VLFLVPGCVELLPRCSGAAAWTIIEEQEESDEERPDEPPHAKASSNQNLQTTSQIDPCTETLKAQANSQW